MTALATFAPLASFVDLAVKSIIVMLASVILVALLRQASAAWRHLAWCLGVGGLLVLPVYAVLLPQWPLPWMPSWPPHSVEAIPSQQVDSPQTAPSSPLEHILASEPQLSVPTQEIRPANDNVPVTASELLPASQGPNWAVLVIAVWLTGSLISLSPLALGFFQLIVLGRRSSPIIETNWVSLLTTLQTNLGVRRAVSLRCANGATMPMTWGVLRPVLLVPAEADTWTSDRQRLVLLHELAHIRRWDWLTQTLAQIACGLYWFNPLAWLAAHQMLVERERACDDEVIASGVNPSDYADQLLQIAARSNDARPTAFAAVPMARRRTLETRLTALLDAQRRRASMTSVGVRSAALLLLIVLAPLAMLHAAEPQEAAPSPKTPKELPAQLPEVKAANTSVTVHGIAVDDITNQPVGPLIVQAGKFDPADPAKVSWGFTETRSSATNGSFSATIKWDEGWTARILADGYVPQPVVSSAPPAGNDVIEVTIRLKRGRIVSGQVLDHTGKPVKDAAVFAIGPTPLNLWGGKAWSAGGEIDAAARPAITYEGGRFDLAAGEAQSLAVSFAGLNAWPAAIPENGKIIVHLPQPARVDIEFDIEGAPKEGTVFYQLLGYLMPGFTRLETVRTLPITNGGKLSLIDMTPGKYQISRNVSNRIGNMGLGAMLDREFFEVKSGETKTIHWVRAKGAQVRGKIAGPDGVKLEGVVISIKSQKTEKDPFRGSDWQTVYASQTAAADGTFLTERILPGSYLLVAEGYTPPPEDQRGRLGRIGPSHRVETTINVPEAGELVVPELVLQSIKGR